MPSYRVTIAIGALQRGVRPDAVLPAAAAAAAERTVVEASDLAVVAGTARATVRFTADDGAAALAVGGHVVEQTRVLADPVSWLVTERVKGRWLPVR
jgi:ABC-type tungstate transport system substrate-binding protein